eukprot:TRINITY_DN15442_c0_g1_i1.p1 TRINITY_DN15442_c0_g1~~TRINITY_DN15442_c0_g1_i1.p1  ORF type:complete len:257 (-),score=38.18 TRINITY_DN15442_c0_g1_i1:43-813(-)
MKAQRCAGTAVLLCLLLAMVAVCASQSFKPDRVHIIDYTNSTSGLRNYLFRGNEPRSANDTFAWAQLTSTLRLVAKRDANITLPSDFYFVDLNLLNYVTEWKDIDMEKDFFKANPSFGDFVNWPIVGDLVGPDDFSRSEVKEMALTLNDWQLPDQLPKKMQMLRQMLNTKGPNGRSLVYYIHCEAGTDRTGEVSGSYYMKYLNWTYQQALAFDATISHRPISVFSRNGLQWYCYYLMYAEGRSNLNCTNPSALELM